MSNFLKMDFLSWDVDWKNGVLENEMIFDGKFMLR